MSSNARLALLAALCGALLPHVRSNPFCPIEAAGPAGAQDMIQYDATIDSWVFVDFFAGIHDRMFVQVCAGPVRLCPSQPLAIFGNCSELTRHDAESAWRSVERLPHDCPRTPVETHMRAEMPNRIVIANRIEEMWHYAQPHNASDGSLLVRVRIVYETFLDWESDARHMRANAYNVLLVPVPVLMAGVVVQTECSARGLTSPGADLPPVLGGSTMAVYPRNVSELRTRLCAWSCAFPFTKQPWNAQAIGVGVDRLTVTAGCRAVSNTATVVSSSFVLTTRLSPFASAARSLYLLAELDAMAARVQDATREQGESLLVLFGLRHSVYNIMSLRDLSALYRARAKDKDVVANMKFVHASKRRLLTTHKEDWVVDALFITDRQKNMVSTLKRAVGAIYATDISRVAPELFVSGVFDVDIEEAYALRLGWRAGPPVVPNTPEDAMSAASPAASAAFCSRAAGGRQFGTVKGLQGPLDAETGDVALALHIFFRPVCLRPSTPVLTHLARKVFDEHLVACDDSCGSTYILCHAHRADHSVKLVVEGQELAVEKRETGFQVLLEADHVFRHLGYCTKRKMPFV